jgi:serine/threonine-protein kinase
MAVPLEQFVRQLEDSGIIAGDTLQDFIPPKAAPKDAEELARELVRQKKLTKFQAEEVYRGKGKSLVLGNYALLDKIGAGGMGQVFKAEHRRMHRIVAVKVLPASMMKNSGVVARFEREVTAAAKLSHPNIVAAHDADEANGVHFLVMEFVEGSDLSALVKKQGPLPVDQAVNCIVQAARGLEAAHAEGVVHRDIKPGNLLLDKKGIVKILDMGLARMHGDAAGQAELTATGAIMGTVDYMAPEQARSTKTADARADIYSLGCSLFYLLTGKATYDGDTLTEKLLAHQSDPIPELRKILPDVPEELEAVFRTMVAKKVDDRYQTVTEVIAALENCGSQPPAARAETADSFMEMVITDVRDGLSKPRTIAPRKRAAGPAFGKDKKKLLMIGGGVVGGLALMALLIFSLTKKQGTPVAKPEPAAAEKKPVADGPNEGPPPSNPGAPKFTDIFNGQDLSGWEFCSGVDGDTLGAHWQVDAVEHVLTSTGPARSTFLLTEKDYADFVLMLEYQFDSSVNSGVVLLASPEDREGYPEIQIGDQQETTGTLWVPPKYSAIPVAQAPSEKRNPEWNSLEIELRGRKLKTRVNGGDVSQFDLDEVSNRPDATSVWKRTQGRIGLQSNFGKVRFRNVRIAEITPASQSAYRSAETLTPTDEGAAWSMSVTRDIPYSSPENDKQVLDVYAPPAGKGHPLIVWVHGGGWEMGDKGEVQAKPEAFVRKGFAFISINYRLMPFVTIEQIAADVAKAIRWTHDRAVEYRGDPRKIVVMGWSAGSQLAALVCTDPSYLKAEGLSLAAIKGCIAVDGDTFDVPRRIATVEEPVANIYRRKFGDEEAQKKLSSVYRAARGNGIPPFLLLYGDYAGAQEQTQRLAAALRQSDVSVKEYTVPGKDHMKINADLGLPDDIPTKVMFEFLDQLLRTDKTPAERSETNSALEFDGRGSVDVPAFSAPNDQPQTLECWVQPTAGGDLRGLVRHPPWYLQFQTPEKETAPRWSFVGAAPDQSQYYVAPSPPVKALPPKLVHIAGVYDGDKMRLFVGGKLQTESLQIWPERKEITNGGLKLRDHPGGSTINIGGSFGKPAWDLTGRIDEIRISTVARYTRNFVPERRFQPDGDTLALYHCDEGQGSVLHDDSQHGRDGKINGAKWVAIDH